MRRTLAAVLLSVAATGCLAVPSGAQDSTQRGVTVGITYDPTSKAGIVVLPIGGVGGDSVGAIVARDLDFTDRFTVVPLDSSDQTTFRGRKGQGLNYALFGKLGAVAVVQITLTPRGLHLALHDVAKAGVATVTDVPLPEPALGREWRAAVHGAADAVTKWITGQPGIAQTRIAFIRGGTMHVVDYDGWGDRVLPTPGSPMSPAWNPAGTSIAYNTYGVSSRIMVLDLGSGRSRSLNGATPNGTNLTPTFAPDGSTIVYSHASEEGSDLFSTDLDGDDAHRVSVGRGTDNAQPSFSPDGRRIAFTSGRAGHPEIYIMDADGTNAELLTSFDFGDQNYRSDPDWSPDGRLVAFQSQFAGRFQIMTIALRDRATKLLTSEGENEQPSWAPDGRHLVFTSTRTGVRELWVLDTESGRARQLTHAPGARLGAWSPRLGGR